MGTVFKVIVELIFLAFVLLRTDSIKINRPGYNIRNSLIDSRSCTTKCF